MTSTGLTAGVHIATSKCVAVVIDDDGAVLAQSRVDTPRGTTELLDVVEAICTELITVVGAVDSVGVGVAGQLDLSGRMAFSPNLDLGDVPLLQLLETRLDRPIVIDNDANLAAMAELEWGIARGISNAVLMTIGSGFGNALIIDGAVRRGAFGMAGELGHTMINPSGPECSCGSRGCLEVYTSGRGLDWMARQAAIAGLTPQLLTLAGGDAENVQGEHVMRGARNDDPGALAILDQFAFWMAVGLSNAVALLDPELVILGGDMADDWDLYGHLVRTHHERLV
ncbi:MAG: ROK family protein, partial [Actinobacteria bacterium]|nr:ROK family protein [Actinomycetota bacterium]